MEKQSQSYGQIVRSTGIFGGSQLLNMLIAFLRNKVAALLIGPLGVGLMGLYQSVVDFVHSVSDLGLSFSAVKDVSEAQASGDGQRISRTALTLRRWVLLTAVLGALLTLAFSKQLSRLVFEDEQHVVSICILSFSVFLAAVSAGQRALLQGMRHIGDMAKSSVLGSLLGFLISSVLFWLFKEEGVVPALLASSLATLVFSGFYVWKMKIPSISQTWADTFRQGRQMVKLGCFNMASLMAATLTMMLVKSYLGKMSDIETVGLFQSSWSVTAMSVSAILSAMATDYFPRLCAVSHDSEQMKRYVNEQLHVAILVSVSLVVAMLLFSPLVLRILYSAKFIPAEGILRWQILGAFLKVLNWPLGFVILSKGRGFVFMLTEFLWYGLYFAFCLLGWPVFGLEGIGMAYVGAHILYTPVVALIAKRLCGWRPDAKDIGLGLVSLLFVAAAFAMAVFLSPSWFKWTLSAALLLLSLVYSLWQFNRIWPLAVAWNKLKNRLNHG